MDFGRGQGLGGGEATRCAFLNEFKRTNESARKLKGMLGRHDGAKTSDKKGARVLGGMWN